MDEHKLGEAPALGKRIYSITGNGRKAGRLIDTALPGGPLITPVGSPRKAHAAMPTVVLTYRNVVTHIYIRHVVTNGLNGASALVAHNYRPWPWNIAVHNVEIAVAYSRCRDPNQHFPAKWRRNDDVLKFEPAGLLPQDRCAHSETS